MLASPKRTRLAFLGRLEMGTILGGARGAGWGRVCLGGVEAFLLSVGGLFSGWRTSASADGSAFVWELGERAEPGVVADTDVAVGFPVVATPSASAAPGIAMSSAKTEGYASCAISKLGAVSGAVFFALSEASPSTGTSASAGESVGTEESGLCKGSAFPVDVVFSGELALVA